MYRLCPEAFPSFHIGLGPLIVQWATVFFPSFPNHVFIHYCTSLTLCFLSIICLLLHLLSLYTFFLLLFSHSPIQWWHWAALVALGLPKGRFSSPPTQFILTDDCWNSGFLSLFWDNHFYDLYKITGFKNECRKSQKSNLFSNICSHNSTVWKTLEANKPLRAKVTVLLFLCPLRGTEHTCKVKKNLLNVKKKIQIIYIRHRGPVIFHKKQQHNVVGMLSRSRVQAIIEGIPLSNREVWRGKHQYVNWSSSATAAWQSSSSIWVSPPVNGMKNKNGNWQRIKKKIQSLDQNPVKMLGKCLRRGVHPLMRLQ